MGMAIQISELTKQYPSKSTPALDQLTLNVERGEIFGYLGPNGAGKTTTIRLMLDLIRPTSGGIRIFGKDVHEESRAVRFLLGNLPGELHLWNHMTGLQTIRYLAKLRPGCDLNYAWELAERLDLNLHVKTGSYSTGNRRKVGIIQAMMHRPPLLILDEPTNGLDPLVRQTFHELLVEARNNGQTVFLSSHILSEVQAVCDQVAILRAGVLQHVSHVADLQRSIERDVTIYSTDVLDDGIWGGLQGVLHTYYGEGFVRLRVAGSLDSVVKHAARYTVEDMVVETVKLEQLFMDFYHD